MPSTTSTNMNLVLPTVGAEPGQMAASDLNADLLIIDQHNHAPGAGVAIPPSGMNINADLPFTNNNATDLKSCRFFVQSAVLSGGSDLGCLYVTGVDLYFNDVNGNQIRMTQSGSISGTSGSIGSLTSPASATYVSATPAFVFQSAANTSANLDGASLVLRNLVASSKGLTLAPPNSMAADYTLTLPSLPAQTNVMTLTTSGTMGSATYDAIGQAMSATGANAINNVRTTTVTSNGSDPGLGGVSVSASSSNFSTLSTSATDVTNLACTLTVSGRPVVIELQTALNIGSVISSVSISSSTTSAGAYLQFIRGASTNVGNMHISAGNATNQNVEYPAGSFRTTDFPAAGTYTWKVQVYSDAGTTSTRVTSCKLVVYER